MVMECLKIVLKLLSCIVNQLSKEMLQLSIT